MGPTLLTQHIAKATVGSGPGDSVFDSGGNGVAAAVGGDAMGSVIHGPEPAPVSPQQHDRLHQVWMCNY